MARTISKARWPKHAGSPALSEAASTAPSGVGSANPWAMVFERRQAEKLAMSEIAMSLNGDNHKRRRVDIASPKKVSVPKRHAEEKASKLRQDIARGPVSMESLRRIQDAMYRQSR